ncbi:MAG: hypothetical protein WBW53_13605 [Terriglobales bacterium]
MDTKEAGRKGGLSRSARKIAAVRQNIAIARTYINKPKELPASTTQKTEPQTVGK